MSIALNASETILTNQRASTAPLVIIPPHRRQARSSRAMTAQKWSKRVSWAKRSVPAIARGVR